MTSAGKIYVVNARNYMTNSDEVIYCGRGCYGWKSSPLGNPFKIGRDGDRDQVVEKFRVWLEKKYQEPGDVRNEIRRILKLYSGGHVIRLACWCHPKNCHCYEIKRLVVKLYRKLYD